MVSEMKENRILVCILRTRFFSQQNTAIKQMHAALTNVFFLLKNILRNCVQFDLTLEFEWPLSVILWHPLRNGWAVLLLMQHPGARTFAQGWLTIFFIACQNNPGAKLLLHCLHLLACMTKIVRRFFLAEKLRKLSSKAIIMMSIII